MYVDPRAIHVPPPSSPTRRSSALTVDQRQPEVVEQPRAATARCMSLLDAALAQREFVAGPTRSLADLALGPSVYRWFELHVERPKQPHLQAWYERMAKRPGFLTHVMVGLS